MENEIRRWERNDQAHSKISMPSAIPGANEGTIAPPKVGILTIKTMNELIANTPFNFLGLKTTYEALFKEPNHKAALSRRCKNLFTQIGLMQISNQYYTNFNRGFQRMIHYGLDRV